MTLFDDLTYIGIIGSRRRDKKWLKFRKYRSEEAAIRDGRLVLV